MAYFDDINFVAADVYPRCRFAVDRVFPDVYAVQFVRSGAMRLAVDDGPEVILNHPAVFWHHPRHRYRYGPVDSFGWRHYWISFQGKRAARIIEEGFMPLAKAGFVEVARPLEMEEEFSRLVRLVHGGEGTCHGHKVTTLENIVWLTERESRESACLPSHGAEIVLLGRRICADACRPVDFRKEAQRLRMSFSHFRRLFRQYVGMSPHEYLLERRMRAAASMLHDPHLLVKEVAAAAGCADTTRFSKLFRQKIGLSPAKYRDLLPRKISPI